MSLFKKENEVKDAEVVQESEATPVPTAQVSENQGDPDPSATPIDPHEAGAVKMLIIWYPDTKQIGVENVQNLSRSDAKDMIKKVLEAYEHDELANVVVAKLIDVISKNQKAGKVWVPGSK